MASEPLTAEEEAKFRRSVEMLDDHWSGEYAPLQWSNTTAMRLLATLDAARAIPREAEGLRADAAQALTMMAEHSITDLSDGNVRVEWGTWSVVERLLRALAASQDGGKTE